MKQFIHFKKAKLLLTALIALFAGGMSPAWADTLTENFDEVTRLDANGNEVTGSYSYGYSLSNGWFVSPAGACISASNSYHYGIATGGNTGNALWAGYGSTQSYYMIIPTQLVGEVTFKAKKTSSSSSTKGYIRLYEVTEDNGTYTVTSTQLGSTVEPSTNSAWNDYSINIGDEGKYVALHMIRSGLDDFEATIYEETGLKKPKNLTASNVTGSSADLSWTAGGEETDWELSYSTTSGDPDNGTIISLTETSYSLTGLTAETTYYASVRAKIGEEYSAWSKEVNFTPSNAVKLTVNDGTATNSYVPIYGNYVDAYDKVEFVIPASDLADMANSDIKAIQFYMSTVASASWGNANFKIYMKEVDYTTISSYVFTDDDTPLYNGAIDGTNADMALTLSTPYHYEGGNLLIGVYNTVKGTYKASAFYGVSATSGASAYGTNSSSLASVTSVNKQSFLPKTTFTYLPVDGPVMKVSETAFDFGTITAESEDADKVKTFTISNTGNATLEGITVSYTGDDVFSTSPAISAQSIAVDGDAITVTVTMATETPGDYSGTITVSATDQTPVEIAVSGTYAANPATMAITLGEEAVGATVAFGNVGKQATKTFTVTNTGNLKLNITSIVSSNTTDFTVSPASLEVAGGSSETFTVTFLYDEEALDAEKTANITVTASNEGIDPIVFAVTGTRIEQWSEDFSGNTLPDGWEITNSSYWKIEDNIAKGSYSYGNYDLVTPSLVVEEDQTMTFDYRMTSTYRSLDIQYSKNNGAWTNYGTISYSGLTLNQWYTYTIGGLEAGNYKFRFGDSNYDLDNFQGFKRNMNDPKLGIYSDAECTEAVATSVTKDFGFATETQTATYYIKNDGTGTMTLSLGDAPADLTQSLDKTSVAAGEYATLTITMPAENKGYNGGNVVVTATDLGTFTVAASGVIVDDTKMDLDFATATIPATWTTNSWSKNASGYVEVGYSSSPVTMQTSNLTAVAGEDLVVIAKQSYASTSYSFGVKYKKIDAEEWSDLIPAANIGTSYVMLHGTIAEAGTYQLQFNGQYTQIQRIYGLTVPEEPVMVVYDGESVAAATYDFGNVSDEADATWTLTVKNEGKSELTGLAAALTGDNAAHYSVEVAATTVAVDGSTTITVKQLKDNLGSHTATLTISATGLDNQVITLSGNTYDHTKLFVDFDNPNAIPTGWSAGTSWSVYTYGDDRYAQQSNYSTASALVTTPLTVAENETLKFQAGRYSSYSAGELKVRYTADGGLTWSEYVDYSSQITSSTFVDLELTDVPDGTVAVEFYGRYVKLDNIYGFTPTTAPLFALTESSTAVANGSTKEFGSLTAEATATYTLTNNGNGAMVSTVATTGVATAVISGAAEGVTIDENTVTLAAGKSATITLTLPYVAPYGEKDGAMTITTEGWVGDFTVNYTATTVDPTALYEDFSGNAKPEGWYSNTWTYTSGYASAAYTATAVDMITAKLSVSGTDDVLSYEARAYNTSWYDPILTIQYSTDRKNWTDVPVQPTGITNEFQQFEISGIAAGEYYLKFSGARVYVDNIIGWHKVTGIEHDLYVSASSFPTTTLVPGTTNGVSASVTVNSLRADETGVYAKLFFNETEMVKADEKDIAKDANASFSLISNVPTEEGTYAAKIVVYYSDGTVAFETLTTNVEVAHTRTLSITAFARYQEEGEEDVLVADWNNQISPAFDVTVKNTGSTSLTPIVKIKQGETVVGTATAAEAVVSGLSTTLRVNATDMSAGEGGTLSFTAEAYWSSEEGATAYPYETPVEITVTAAAPKFALYQDATPVNDGDDVDFGLTKSTATYSYSISNEGSAALELTNINVPAGFEVALAPLGTTDADWMLYFYKDAESNGDAGTFKTTGTDGVFVLENVNINYADGANFCVRNGDWSTKYGWTEAGGSVTTTGYACQLGTSEGANCWFQMPAGNYDVIWNSNDLTITFWNNNTIPAGESRDVAVTLQAEQGKVAGDLIFTYKVDATTNNTFTLALSGRSVAADTWTEDFESGSIPSNWDNSNGWTVYESDGNNVARLTGWDAKAIITPRLAAQKDEILTFDVLSVGNSISYAYSTDRVNWSDEVDINAAGEQTFTAPANGNYYLRITARNAYIDNFVGFRLNPNNLVLNETETPVFAGEVYDNITLNRNFIAGWNTVCLPFAIADIEEFFGTGAYAYSFSSFNAGEITFAIQDAMTAATPYLVYVPEAIASKNLTNVTVSDAAAGSVEQGGVTFQGTYAPIAAGGDLTGKYVLTPEAKIQEASSSASMKGFRAYFNTNGASVKALVFDDGTATRIVTIDNGQLTMDNVDVYNLAGQKLNQVRKGVNIVNGKKVLVK